MKTLHLYIVTIASGVLAAALLLGALAAQAAPQGNTYIVGGSADSVGACSPSIGGYSCPSLRSAIIAANNNPGADIIQLTHGVTYTLTIAPSGADDATTGDLNITGDTTFNFGNTICFSNCAATIRGGAGWNDRILNIASGARVDAFSLTIRNGHILGAGDAIGGGVLNNGTLSLASSTIFSNSASSDGGGIVNNGTLILTDTTIMSNTASYGGGLRNGHSSTTATITLANCLITGNQAFETAGILNRGTLWITGGTISHNASTYEGAMNVIDGGGIAQISGTLIMTGTLVYSNTSYVGGGLSIYGGVTRLTGITVTQNTADMAGGGLSNIGGSVSVIDSSIDHNTVGGVFNNLSTGGAGVFNFGALTLENSTVTANHVITGSAGGLLNWSDATIRNSTIAANSAVTYTGGVLNAAVMTLDNARINGNTAQWAAGLENREQLTILGGTISGNTATAGVAGVYNAGALTATHLSVANNQDLTGYGGGFQNRGIAQLVNTQIVNNSAPVGWGAGVMNDAVQSQLTLDHVTIISNTGQAASGIYNNQGTITITANTIAHNVATAGPGGGILNATFISGPGPLYGSLQMDSSTVFDNRASTQGGGIYNAHILTITNSTLSDNRAGDSGGGLFSDAGYDPNPTAYLNNVTIADNQADSNNDGVGKGGGVAILSGTVSLRNTLIGVNTDLSSQAPDCSGPLTSDRYNLVQNTAGCTLSGNLVGNITGQDPRLGSLQDNGGATWTQALLSGSPAIDAGNPSTPGSGLAACLAFDQRGVPRPVGPRCDIGAFEAGAALFKVYLPLVMR